MALREIHAIRLKLYEERKGLSPEEYNALVRKSAAAFFGGEDVLETYMGTAPNQ
jgi:hypothetical protein